MLESLATSCGMSGHGIGSAPGAARRRLARPRSRRPRLRRRAGLAGRAVDVGLDDPAARAGAGEAGEVDAAAARRGGGRAGSPSRGRRHRPWAGGAASLCWTGLALRGGRFGSRRGRLGRGLARAGLAAVLGDRLFRRGRGGAAAPASSPSPAISAMTVPTFTSSVPSATRIFAIVPSSTASNSIVALSVSISASRSPGGDRVALLDQPFGERALLHRRRLRAGIFSSIGMVRESSWRRPI